MGLKVAETDDACLGALRALGLTIDRVVKNKIIGSIAADCLAALRDDARVAEVELSASLDPHAEA